LKTKADRENSAEEVHEQDQTEKNGGKKPARIGGEYGILKLAARLTVWHQFIPIALPRTVLIASTAICGCSATSRLKL